MKPPSPRTSLFVIYSSRRLLITNRHFSTASTYNPNSHNYNTPTVSRRHEEESRNVRVFVWWDFENCSVPVGSNVYRVSQSITTAIRSNGIKGPVQITAFGDVQQLSRCNQEALSATGIILSHIPRGGKNSADRSLLVDLMYWVSQNPPPAHLFMISSDRDFASILHRLRMNNYNILLASQESAPGVLCSAASIMWEWSSLVKGENFTGKHFNQPPDGPYGSWYGHYRVPIEDPFAVTEQPGCLQPQELSNLNSDAKSGAVPKAVINMIRKIVKSYPEGISITALRAELAKSNITIENDLYGYKRFSRFLLSMPHILTLKSEGDGHFLVHGTTKFPGAYDSSVIATPGPATDIENPDSSDSCKKFLGDKSSKTNSRAMSSKQVGNEKTSLPSSAELDMKKPLVELQEPLKEAEDTQKQVQAFSPPVEKVSSGEVITIQLRPIVDSCPNPEVGFLKRIWSKWFGGKETKVKSCDTIVKSSVPEDDTDKIKHDVESGVSTSTSSETVGLPASSSSSQKAGLTSSAASSSSSNEIDRHEDVNRSAEVNHTSIRSPDNLSQFKSWCKSWLYGQSADNLNEEFAVEKSKRSIALEMKEMFSESFWNDMLAFLKTTKGSDSIQKSKTRKEIMQNLQKQGPPSLSSLSEHHLHHLVDSLVSEKHWVEEAPSQPFPFRLVLSAGKSSESSCASTKDWSSIFSDRQSKMSSQLGQGEKDGDRRCKNLPQTGVSPRVIPNKPADKSRAQVLGDCRKLVNEILKELPNGFNLGHFRKLFLERYGYSLDVQKLGYQKLATLMQIRPGVKIESNYILPSSKVSKSSSAEVVNPNVVKAGSNSRRKDPTSRKEDDDPDSPWEELGPVATNSGSKRNDVLGGSSWKVKESAGQQKLLHGYEKVPQDDISDSEEEMLSLGGGSEGQEKHREIVEDSSLLQILDSWYSSKGEDNRKIAASPLETESTADEMVNCSTIGLKPSSSGVGIKNESAVEVNYGRKQRASKTYSFVTDEVGNNKDKLVDGILCSLKTGDGLSESRI